MGAGGKRARKREGERARSRGTFKPAQSQLLSPRRQHRGLGDASPPPPSLTRRVKPLSPTWCPGAALPARPATTVPRSAWPSSRPPPRRGRGAGRPRGRGGGRSLRGGGGSEGAALQPQASARSGGPRPPAELRAGRGSPWASARPPAPRSRSPRRPQHRLQLQARRPRYGGPRGSKPVAARRWGAVERGGPARQRLRLAAVTGRPLPVEMALAGGRCQALGLGVPHWPVCPTRLVGHLWLGATRLVQFTVDVEKLLHEHLTSG